MDTYEFTIVLDRAPNDEDFDRIFDAGLDDTTPETREGRGVLNVHREAKSLTAAILSTVADIERAGFTAVAIEDEDLVSLKTVAQRLGRSYESVRLLATGKRGPGNFPAPLSGDGWALYSWAQVSDWVSAQESTSAAPSDDMAEKLLEYSRVIGAASQLMRARAIASPETIAALIPLVIPIDIFSNAVAQTAETLTQVTDAGLWAVLSPTTEALVPESREARVEVRQGNARPNEVRADPSRTRDHSVTRQDGRGGETVSKSPKNGVSYKARDGKASDGLTKKN